MENLGLDAPVLEDVVDDQIQDDAVEVEGAEQSSEEDHSQEQQQPAEVKGDERLIKQAWRDLKATHPQLFSEYKGLFFGKRDLDAKLEGFDVDGVKSWLEETGGREALEGQITELTSKAAELDGINEAIAKGDASLVSEIAELHPESFPKLAEATLNTFAQKHPEDYSRVMSGIMASTLQSSGVPMFLERMALYLEVGKTQELAQSLQQLIGWSKSFGEAAAKQPQSVSQKNEQFSQREQAIAQREQKAYSDNYLQKLEGQRKPMIEEALKDYIAMRPDSAGTKDRAIAAAVAEIEKTLGKDQQFVRAVQAFHAKGDAEGALRLVKSRESRVLAEIAKTVGEDFYGKLGPKVVAKPAQNKPAVNQQKRPNQQPAKPKDKFAEIFASA